MHELYNTRCVSVNDNEEIKKSRSNHREKIDIAIYIHTMQPSVSHSTIQFHSPVEWLIVPEAEQLYVTDITACIRTTNIGLFAYKKLSDH